MALGLFTGGEKAEIRALQREVDALTRQVAELSTKLSTGSLPALSVQVNELEAALQALQKSNRRELGRLWKLLGTLDEPDPRPDNAPPSLDRDGLRAQYLRPPKVTKQ